MPLMPTAPPVKCCRLIVLTCERGGGRRYLRRPALQTFLSFAICVTAMEQRDPRRSHKLLAQPDLLRHNCRPCSGILCKSALSVAAAERVASAAGMREWWNFWQTLRDAHHNFSASIFWCASIWEFKSGDHQLVAMLSSAARLLQLVADLGKAIGSSTKRSVVIA